MKRCCTAWVIVIMLFACVCSCFASGAENTAVELQQLEWTWEPLSTATFEGTVSFGSDAPEQVVLKLSFSVQPDDSDPGEVVFQTVNEKKLTLRKQKSTCSVTRGDEDTLRFTGSWKTPESVFFTRIEITCRAYNEDESILLAENKLVFTRTASEIAQIDDGRIRLKIDFSEWTGYAAIAAGVIWLLAAARILINKRERKK